jgi:hypothetical protein
MCPIIPSSRRTGMAVSARAMARLFSAPLIGSHRARAGV